MLLLEESAAPITIVSQRAKIFFLSPRHTTHRCQTVCGNLMHADVPFKRLVMFIWRHPTLMPTSSGELGRNRGFSMSSSFLMPSITLSLRVCRNCFSLSHRARLNRRSNLVLEAQRRWFYSNKRGCCGEMNLFIHLPFQFGWNDHSL